MRTPLHGRALSDNLPPSNSHTLRLPPLLLPPHHPPPLLPSVTTRNTPGTQDIPAIFTPLPAKKRYSRHQTPPLFPTASPPAIPPVRSTPPTSNSTLVTHSFTTAVPPTTLRHHPQYPWHTAPAPPPPRSVCNLRETDLTASPASTSTAAIGKQPDSAVEGSWLPVVVVHEAQPNLAGMCWAAWFLRPPARPARYGRHVTRIPRTASTRRVAERREGTSSARRRGWPDRTAACDHARKAQGVVVPGPRPSCVGNERPPRPDRPIPVPL